MVNIINELFPSKSLPVSVELPRSGISHSENALASQNTFQLEDLGAASANNWIFWFVSRKWFVEALVGKDTIANSIVDNQLVACRRVRVKLEIS